MIDADDNTMEPENESLSMDEGAGSQDTGDKAPEDEDSAAEETDGGEENREQESEEESEARKRRRSGAERFRRQRERAEIAEARAAALEARLAVLESAFSAKNIPLTSGQNENNNDGIEAPNPDNYRYGDLDPAYLADLAEWKAELKVAALKKEILASQQQQAAQLEAEKISREIAETVRIGSQKFPDFEDVVIKGAEAGEWALTRDVYDAVMESDRRDEIFYYLATHPDESEEVVEMTPARLFRWIGKMEATLAAPAPRKATKAPAPVSTARGAGGRFVPNPATMDFNAFERLVKGNSNG